MTIGVLGAGAMGLPIAAALHHSGARVAAFDSDPARRDALRAAGIYVAKSGESLARSVDALLTVLPEGDAVHDAMPTILQLPTGALWIDLSSGDPRLSEIDHPRAREAGIRPVAAPMSGGPREAAAGELGVFVSGSADDVESARDILCVLGRAESIRVVGAGSGDAQLAKLLANLLWFGQVIATTEALLLGARRGLNVRVLADALRESAGGSAYLDRHVDRLLAGDYLQDFALDRCVAELRIVTDLARDAGSPAELSALVARTHEQALERFGPVMGELLAARLLEERADQQLRSPQ